MLFVENDSQFNKLIRKTFPILNYYKFDSLMAVSAEGKALAGCAFLPLPKNSVSVFLLSLSNRWASREVYAEFLRYPFEQLHADCVVARCGKNQRSKNIGKRLQIQFDEQTNTFTLSKTIGLQIAQQLVNYAQKN